MFRFIVRRLLQLIPTLLGLSILLFIWLRRLPGGPETAILGERGTPESRAAIRRNLGLDEPILIQYGRFMKRMLRLDLGVSTSTKREVTTEFLQRFPGTVELTIMALIIAIGVGIPLGYLAARKRGRFLDHASVGGSLIGICIPVFFLAYVLKAIFAENLVWFPASGRQDPTIGATRVTNFFVLDGLLTREWDAAFDALWHLVLPGLALASIPLAIIVRMTRASVLEVLGEDYVRTAESKGLTESVVRRRHVLRNALLPVSTTIGSSARITARAIRPAHVIHAAPQEVLQQRLALRALVRRDGDPVRERRAQIPEVDVERAAHRRRAQRGELGAERLGGGAEVLAEQQGAPRPVPLRLASPVLDVLAIEILVRITPVLHGVAAEEVDDRDLAEEEAVQVGRRGAAGGRRARIGRRVRGHLLHRRYVLHRGPRPDVAGRATVVAGDDPLPLGVDVRVVGLFGRSGRRRLVGELGQVVAGGAQVGPVDVEAVDRAGRNGGGAGHRVQVGRGLQVGGDAAGGQHVQQMLAHTWIDVTGDREVLRVQPVVPPSPACSAR